MNRRGFKAVKLLAGLGISFAFAWHILDTVPFQSLLTSLMNGNISLILVAGIVHLMSFIIRASRYRRFIGLDKSVNEFPVISISFMMNNTMPFRFGDLYRGYLVKLDNGLPYVVSTFGVLVEKLSDGLGLTLVLICAATLMPSSPKIDSLRLIAEVTFIGGMVLIMIYFATYKQILSKFPNVLIQRIRHLTSRITEIFTLKTLLATVGDTFVVWFLEWVACVLVLMAFHQGVGRSMVASLLLLSVVNIGIMIPSSPGYIGTFEYFGVVALGVYAMDKVHALAIVFTLHAVQFIPITISGLICLILRYIQGRPIVYKQSSEGVA